MLVAQGFHPIAHGLARLTSCEGSRDHAGAFLAESRMHGAGFFNELVDVIFRFHPASPAQVRQPAAGY